MKKNCNALPGKNGKTTGPKLPLNKSPRSTATNPVAKR